MVGRCILWRFYAIVFKRLRSGEDGFDDEGAASWTTMTRAELDARFLDPLPLLRAKLVDGRAPRRR